MTCRVLPFEEWSRVDAMDLGQLLKVANPEMLTVIVVEDEHGAIVGCWSVVTFLHAEGLWVAPEHRAKAGVSRRLLAKMKQIVIERGHNIVLTATADPSTDRLVTHAGGMELGGRHYALQVAEQTWHC